MFNLILQAFAQNTSPDTTITSIVNAVISGVLNPLITLLFVLATVVFIWGVTQYVIAQADEKKIADSKRVMFWGIIGMFLMVSSWGIVRILCDFFGSCGYITFPAT